MQPPTATEFVESVGPLFKKRSVYRTLIALAVVSVVVSYGTWFMIPAIIFLLVIVPVLVRYEVALETRVWQMFAEQLDVVHTSNGRRAEPLKGVVGELSNGRLPSLLAAGLYHGYSVRLLEQTVYYRPTSRSSAPSYMYRILEITTNQQYYPVFLDSKSNNARIAPHVLSTAMNVLALSVGRNRQLTVEGDANKFFRIYVPANARYESLVTLSPEKLLALRNYGKAFDVEFTDNKIYLITDSKIRSVKEVMLYQEAVFELLKNIGVDITRKRNDVASRLSVYIPNVLT